MNTEELFIDGYNLPKQLSKQETYDLLKKVRQGDENSKEVLARHTIKLVLYEVTGRFKSVEYDKKDLVSIGNIGLMKAILNFDISKKVEFSTYAIRCIDNEILMFLRKLKKEQKNDSIDRTISFDNDGTNLKIKDMIYDETDIVEDYMKREIYQTIRQIVNNLPNREREIIMLYFGFYNNTSYTQKEIANMMSVCQPYISRLVQKILKRIKYDLQQTNIIEIEMNDKETNKPSIKKITL